MSSNASKTPFLRAIAKRGYAAKANPCPSASAEVKSKTLSNKIVVAAAPSVLPVSRVSIVFRAGSRYEKYDNLGSSHVLRLCAGLTTANSSGFAITRKIQQVGGRLTVTSDREIIAYTVETTNKEVETGLKFLQDVATAPAFKPWELADNIPRLKTHLAAVPDQVHAVELLHKAAYRNVLGNSIYCPTHKVGKLSPETLQHFFAQTCTADRCAVVGVGIEENALSGFAQNLEIGSGGGKDEASKYYGGDARLDTSSQLTHVAVAGEAAALSNIKEVVAFAVLQQAYGVKPVAKYGAPTGVLSKAVASALKDKIYSFTTLNASYTDSGLFGLVLSADGNSIKSGLDAAVKALKSGTVSADDIKRGKAVLKARTIRHLGKGGYLVNELGLQAALLGSIHDVNALVAAIDGVSDADVQAAAKKIASSKLSIGAVGNLANVPYVSELA